MVMGPDGAQDQEWLCWRGSMAICCTWLGSQSAERKKRGHESSVAYMNHNINQEKVKSIKVLKGCRELILQNYRCELYAAMWSMISDIIQLMMVHSVPNWHLQKFNLIHRYKQWSLQDWKSMYYMWCSTLWWRTQCLVYPGSKKLYRSCFIHCKTSNFHSMIPMPQLTKKERVHLGESLEIFLINCQWKYWSDIFCT
jgi:hypothetical protein